MIGLTNHQKTGYDNHFLHAPGTCCWPFRNWNVLRVFVLLVSHVGRFCSEVRRLFTVFIPFFARLILAFWEQMSRNRYLRHIITSADNQGADWVKEKSIFQNARASFQQKWLEKMACAKDMHPTSLKCEENEISLVDVHIAAHTNPRKIQFIHHINQKSINLKSLLKPYFLINFTLAMLFEYIFELLCLFWMHYGSYIQFSNSFLSVVVVVVGRVRSELLCDGVFLLLFFGVRVADIFWWVVFGRNMLAFYMELISFGCVIYFDFSAQKHRKMKRMRIKGSSFRIVSMLILPLFNFLNWICSIPFVEFFLQLDVVMYSLFFGSTVVLVRVVLCWRFFEKGL